MSDSDHLPLRIERDRIGYSREMVVRRPELNPPISTKTLERWEAGAPVKGFRYRQLALIYEVDENLIRNGKVAA